MRFFRMTSILCLFSLFNCTLGLAQIDRQAKDFSIELSGGYIESDDYDAVPVGGFTMNYFLGKRVSIISRFSYGPDHLHFSPSLVTAPAFIYSGAWKNGNMYFSSDFFYAVILIASAFENIGFHIPIQEKIELVPNFSLLSFRSFRKVNPNPFDPERTLWGNLKSSGAVGIKINVMLRERLYIAPYAEAFLQYNRGGTWGTNIGAHVGYIFPSAR